MTWYIVGLIVGGFYLGMLFADYCWKWKIIDKAETGIRLECRGRLYNVTEDQPDNGTEKQT